MGRLDQFAAAAADSADSIRDLRLAVERANRSARSLGAVSGRAITPRYVAGTLRPGETVLNFGAGKPNPRTGLYDHSELLRLAGGDVYEYDFGRNAVGADALSRKYDTVMASNVLNTQSDMDMLLRTLEQIRAAAGGRAVFNFPDSPRYLDGTADDVFEATRQIFGAGPTRVGGSRRAPLIEVRLPR